MMEGWSHAKKMTYFKSNPEWVRYEEDEDGDDIPYLTDKATPEAIASYNYWKSRFEESQRTGIIYD